MRRFEWTAIPESDKAGFRLEPGGYVVRIEEARDVPEKELVEVVYDVAEGPCAGFYGDEWGRANQWAHTHKATYKAKGMFKHLLATLERSNAGFSVAQWQQSCDERQLRGLVFGALIQTRYYTSPTTGEDKDALEIAQVVDADVVRRGEYELPAPRDQRKKANPAPPSAYGVPAQAAPATPAYDEYLPF